jgi:hypothetical protein
MTLIYHMHDSHLQNTLLSKKIACAPQFGANTPFGQFCSQYDVRLRPTRCVGPGDKSGAM